MSPDRKSCPLTENIAQAADLLRKLDDLAEPLQRAVDLLGAALLGGHKMLCCGNGGSAADCAHLTAEIAGRFVLERRGFPALDLTANHSLVTALGNDYSAEQIFARQVQALGQPGDVLVAISTSGNSANVILALEAAKRGGLHRIALLGRDGGRCRGLADVELIVPSNITARIQEAHQLLYHTMCQMLDPALAQRAG